MSGIIAERVEYPISEGTFCTAEEGKTRQSDAQAADINLTIKKYNLQPLDLEIGWSGKLGEFMDVASLPTYQEALNQVRKADELFMLLPSDVRDEFQNNSAIMLDAWNAGEKAEVFTRIGFLEKREPKAPVEPLLVQMVQARNDETGRFEAGLEPADPGKEPHSGR